MAYGLIYQGEFDSIAENGYRLEILKKDYTGLFYTLPMAANPVLHRWDNDDIKAPVKGSSLTINYLNKGSNPIENFYSTSDDEFLVKFYNGSQLLFAGFLVQDDYSEIMVDFTHLVQLSANDNLGLLKDVELDVSAQVSYLPTYAEGDFIAITVPVQNWIYLTNVNFTPAVGVPFTITGHPSPSMNGTFTPTVVNTITPTKFDIRTATFTGDQPNSQCSVNSGLAVPANFKILLSDIIHSCLVKTGLELDTYFYCNLFEDSNSTTTSSLHQTLINPETFLPGENYDNCYSVLEKVLSKFKLSLFQSLGRWNIVRWEDRKSVV